VGEVVCRAARRAAAPYRPAAIGTVRSLILGGALADEAALA
jgi:hypothetical protein